MLHLKRWTGVSAGWVLSFEIPCFGTPMVLDLPEGNMAAGEPSEHADGPAESETPSM